MIIQSLKQALRAMVWIYVLIAGIYIAIYICDGFNLIPLELQ